MPIQQWLNKYPGIIYHPTTKLFYRKFLWRLVIHAPGGNLINHEVDDLATALEMRRKHIKHYNWSGSWMVRASQLDVVDLSQLSIVKDIRLEFGNQIRIRVEEPKIQFYTINESVASGIAGKFSIPMGSNGCLSEINGPRSLEEEKILLGGTILKKGPVEFSYLISLRAGNYGRSVKTQILNYLTSLGDQIKIKPSVIQRLNASFAEMWDISFLANDPEIVVFLRLIHPDLVKNIDHIVSRYDK